MKSQSRVLLSIALILSMMGTVNSQHYYGRDGQIPLSIDSSKVLIKFDPDIPFVDWGEVIENIPRIASVIENEEVIDSFVLCSLGVQSGFLEFLDSLQSTDEILFAEPFYTLSNGVPVFVGRTICIGFISSISSMQVDSIADEFGIVVDTAILSNVYTMKNTDYSGQRVLELSNALYQLSQTTFAHPDFGLRPILTAYKTFDFYNIRQTHLKKVTGQYNIASVWDFAGTGDTVIVSVVDDGVIQHEDWRSRGCSKDMTLLAMTKIHTLATVMHMEWQLRELSRPRIQWTALKD